MKARAAVPIADPERRRSAEQLAQASPDLARVGNVLCGTAGWTDPSLLAAGTFYPRASMKPAERLAHYAGSFPLVEVDATYYSLLPVSAADRWVAATPPSFVFDVKAFPVLTRHPIDVERLPRDLRAAVVSAGLSARRVSAADLPGEIAGEMESRFRELVVRLDRAGKLGAILLQFPPWFTATRGSARHLQNLAARWSPLPLAVEFRHPSWLLPERRDRVQRLLRDHQLAYVVVDEPHDGVRGVPPEPWLTSSRLAIVRFHGRNTAGWNKAGATVAERFDWLYTEAELTPWVRTVRELGRGAESVHAVFNNCVQDHAVLGAKGLAGLLLGPKS